MSTLSRIIDYLGATALTALGAVSLTTPTTAVPATARLATLHAEGAQIYECQLDETGPLLWRLREPIATLLADGRTIGRHYAGPTWELADGSAIVARVVARAPGVTPSDLPLMQLEVTARRGAGQLSHVAVVQRINTQGGVLRGGCDTVGALRSVPYSADYALFGPQS